MSSNLLINHLADHREAVPVLKEWLETEWADYYGPTGPGDAAQDLIAYSSREKLPIGLVAFSEGRLCGIAALKPDSAGRAGGIARDCPEHLWRHCCGHGITRSALPPSGWVDPKPPNHTPSACGSG
jgi:hypothetical protein